MTQTNSFDAFGLWKEMYNKTENAWRDLIQETLEKESFAEGLGNVQSQYLQYQEIVNQWTEAYLKQANIPSREEIANIATLIINVDTKIDNLEDEVDEQNSAASKEIDQLKRTVAKLDKKLDRVIELLEASSAPVAATAITTAATTTANANTNQNTNPNANKANGNVGTLVSTQSNSK